jgi:hypothetical protein
MFFRHDKLSLINMFSRVKKSIQVTNFSPNTNHYSYVNTSHIRVLFLLPAASQQLHDGRIRQISVR